MNPRVYAEKNGRLIHWYNDNVTGY